MFRAFRSLSDIDVFDSYKESFNARLQNFWNCSSSDFCPCTKKFTVDALVVADLPSGPLSTHPNTVQVAKGPPSSLGLLSTGCRASSTSLPIRRPISASMCVIFTPFRYCQQFTSSCRAIASWGIDKLGLEKTIGNSTVLFSFILETSKLTKEHSIGSFFRFRFLESC